MKRAFGRLGVLLALPHLQLLVVVAVYGFKKVDVVIFLLLCDFLHLGNFLDLIYI